jgi:hypothetical protein
MTTTTCIPDRHQFRALVAEIAAKARAKLPECNGRVDKAVALVLAGDVAGQGEDGSWRVGSCTDPLVTHRVQGTSCSCDDSQYGKAPRGLCKHVLAVMIQMRTQALLPPAPQGEWPPEEALAAESTPEVHTGCTSPLPEAPVSITLKATLHGHEVLVTLRGHDFASVRSQVEQASQWLQSQTPAPSQQSGPEKRYCPRHGSEMALNHKDGRSWYSHKTAEGWCKGT